MLLYPQSGQLLGVLASFSTVDSSADAAPAVDGLGVATPLAIIDVVLAGGEAIVSPRGELDLSNRDAFGAVLERVRNEAPRVLVIDLAETDFLDASVISIVTHEQAQRDGRLVLRGAHGIVERLLRVVKIAPLQS
jgi:anti-anti-sigma factor